MWSGLVRLPLPLQTDRDDGGPADDPQLGGRYLEEEALDTTLLIIAQTGDRFRDFAPYVASINDDGIVAFQATLTSGGSGVFTGDGVATTRFAETGDFDIAEVISHPDINLEGSLCFYAQLKAGIQSVLLIRDGMVSSDGTAVGPLGPTISETGTVAYRATLPTGESAIFAGELEIARTGERFAGFQGLPVLNGHGSVTFRADLAQGGEGIFVWNQGKLETIAETGNIYSALGRFPIIDDMARVAFTAELCEGGSAVFISTEGRLVTGDFESIRGVLINEDCDLVVYATPPEGTLGIYLRETRILGIGDDLFGCAVSEFALNPVSINRRGQLAIRIKLIDDRQFILRVDPARQIADLATRPSRHIESS